jgi:hypothetical protein
MWAVHLGFEKQGNSLRKSRADDRQVSKKVTNVQAPQQVQKSSSRGRTCTYQKSKVMGMISSRF